MAQLVTSLVITRIDYCNSILAGLPAFRLVPLQRVQNAAAQLVLNLDRRAGRLKMRDMKMRDVKIRHQNARHENARRENSAPKCET